MHQSTSISSCSFPSPALSWSYLPLYKMDQQTLQMEFSAHLLLFSQTYYLAALVNVFYKKRQASPPGNFSPAFSVQCVHHTLHSALSVNYIQWLPMFPLAPVSLLPAPAVFPPGVPEGALLWSPACGGGTVS